RSRIRMELVPEAVRQANDSRDRSGDQSGPDRPPGHRPRPSSRSVAALPSASACQIAVDEPSLATKAISAPSSDHVGSLIRPGTSVAMRWSPEPSGRTSERPGAGGGFTYRSQRSPGRTGMTRDVGIADGAIVAEGRGDGPTAVAGRHRKNVIAPTGTTIPAPRRRP